VALAICQLLSIRNAALVIFFFFPSFFGFRGWRLEEIMEGVYRGVILDPSIESSTEATAGTSGGSTIFTFFFPLDIYWSQIRQKVERGIWYNTDLPNM
jgi:hypothetical protein